MLYGEHAVLAVAEFLVHYTSGRRFDAQSTRPLGIPQGYAASMHAVGIVLASEVLAPHHAAVVENTAFPCVHGGEIPLRHEAVLHAGQCRAGIACYGPYYGVAAGLEAPRFGIGQSTVAVHYRVDGENIAPAAYTRSGFYSA